MSLPPSRFGAGFTVGGAPPARWQFGRARRPDRQRSAKLAAASAECRSAGPGRTT